MEYEFGHQNHCLIMTDLEKEAWALYEREMLCRQEAGLGGLIISWANFEPSDREFFLRQARSVRRRKALVLYHKDREAAKTYGGDPDLCSFPRD